MEQEIKQILERISYNYATAGGTRKCVDVGTLIREFAKIDINIELEFNETKNESHTMLKCIDCGCEIKQLIFNRIQKCNNCYVK